MSAREVQWDDLAVIQELFRKGLAQNDLARFFGVDKGYMSRLMRDPERFRRFLERHRHTGEMYLLRLALENEKVLARLLVPSRRRTPTSPLLEETSSQSPQAVLAPAVG